MDTTFYAPEIVTVLGVALERSAADARTNGDEDTAPAWDAHTARLRNP